MIVATARTEVLRQVGPISDRMQGLGFWPAPLDRLGPERILFAVDYPYEDSAVATGFLRDAPLADEQRALISHRNAERLFRIALAVA